MLLGLVIALALAQSLGRFDALFDGSIEHIGVIRCACHHRHWILQRHPRSCSGQSDWHRRCRNVVDVVWGCSNVFILSGDWQPVVTVIWLLGMTQAINLIDGLDGLAAGIVAIGAGAFFSVRIQIVGSWALEPAQQGLSSQSSLQELRLDSFRIISTRRPSLWVTGERSFLVSSLRLRRAWLEAELIH